MEDIEERVFQCYGLRTVKKSTIGKKINLYTFVGKEHVGNTAIEMIDVYGLHNYLSMTSNEHNLNLYWAIIKTPSLNKDGILVSLSEAVPNNPCTQRIAFPSDEKKSKMNFSNGYESALSESLQMQGIQNRTTLGMLSVDLFVTFQIFIMINFFSMCPCLFQNWKSAQTKEKYLFCL